MAVRHLSVILKVFSFVLIVAGIGVAAAPYLVDQYTAYQAQSKISETESTYDAMTDSARLEVLSQAHAYNSYLSGSSADIAREAVWDYDTQLTYHDEPSTMMSWLEIPKIDVNLVVYHHSTENVLMAGVGHIDTTSLPVGGDGSNCVVSAHSGMPTARMFDDVRALEVGDVFVFWTLKEPYAYRVCEIHDMVEPTNTDYIVPREGRDLATLITCTPYNVNTHRLIVVGERCEYVPEEVDDVRHVNSRQDLPLWLAVFAVVTIGIISVVVRHRKRV